MKFRTDFYLLPWSRHAMIKPLIKTVSLDERERVSFDNVPDKDDFAQHDTSCSGNTGMTAAPWMMGHFLVELEQGRKQRFNSVGYVLECIAATLRVYFGLVFLVRNLSLRELSPFIQFSRRCLQNLGEVQFSRHRLENLGLNSCTGRYFV